MDQKSENTLSPGNHSQSIRRLEEGLERRKKTLFALLHSLPEDRYNLPPSPGTWSVAQAANHLYLSEKLSLAYLKKKMSYPDTIPPYHIKSWLGTLYVSFVLRTSIRVKAPQTIDMWQSQEILSLRQLDEQWGKLRSELFTYIQDTYPQFKNKLVYNHPFGGRMTMRQMLIFIAHHTDHHTRQVKRIMKAIQKIP